MNVRKQNRVDKEEQDILSSFERGEWRPVADKKEESAKHRRYAENTIPGKRKKKEQKGC